MKTFKRLVSFMLALLTLVSVIPLTAISARAAPTDAEMMDNFVLDAMEYLGYNVAGFKASGQMYVSASASVPYAPDIRYDDTWGDNWEGTISGLGTVDDASTPTKKAPNLESIRENGLVCASYTTYYYLNAAHAVTIKTDTTTFTHGMPNGGCEGTNPKSKSCLQAAFSSAEMEDGI